MQRHYIDIGRWGIEIDCDTVDVLQGLSEIFDRFYSDTPPTGKPLLRCTIHRDEAAFATLSESVDSSGPVVDVSPGVTIRYAFEDARTVLSVTKTGIATFDLSRPAECDIYLYPSPTKETEQGLKSAPEAIFYPVLAEWIRNFDACLVHCGAVVYDGRAIFLTGPPGSGKSSHVLRMLLRGTEFLADDLAILCRNDDGSLNLLPLREVANVHQGTLKMFPELSFLESSPLRGDGKFIVNVPRRLEKQTVVEARPGVVLRLDPDDAPWLTPTPVEQCLDRMHNMAWFASRPRGNESHFWLLTDWLTQSEQWIVSRGYMAENLDELMQRVIMT